MNTFTIIVLSIGSLIILVMILGFLSPRITQMERTIEVKAPAEKIFELVNNLKHFNEHISPWSKIDPNMKQDYSAQVTGIGAIYKWKGDKKVGTGSMEVIHSDPAKKVTYHMKFVGRGEADASFVITPTPSGLVNVTWNFVADNKLNPMARLFGRFMEKFIGPDYEKGLQNLKSHMESQEPVSG